MRSSLSRPSPRRLSVWTFAAVLATASAPLGALSGQVLRYADEYPVIAYETAEASDPVAELMRRLQAGELDLEFDVRNGYLTSLLHALDVSPSSQMLVFSKTSLQSAQISAATPRAIYFGDDVYVAWVPGGEGVEIASMDPNLGPVFYTLTADDRSEPVFERETVCLECHDSYSLSGGGVPRFLIGSGITSARGQTVLHGGWNLTTDRTPLERRWGGWYVTGTHGSAVHMGNVTIPNVDAVSRADVRGGGNVTDLAPLLDTSPYLGRHSDIVALLVVEHQIHVQNLLTRANWEVRTALFDNRNVRMTLDEVAALIESVTEPVVDALLFVGEAPLPSPVKGTSDFQDAFQALGPRDAQGRSLRELKLDERLFRYPLSYLIYSEALANLPRPARNRIFQRVRDVLTGTDRDARFSRIGSDGNQALEILTDTHPQFREWLEGQAN